MAKLLFNSDNQPGSSSGQGKRGKGWKAKIIESLERNGKSEEEFIDAIVLRAISGDEFSLREILSRVSPVPKAVSPAVEFFFPNQGTPVEKMDAIIRAVADGDLPADVASVLAGIVKTSLEVMETTELVARMEKLEAIVEQQNNGKAPQ